MPEVIAGLKLPETPTAAAETVWTAIALPATSGNPGFQRTTTVERIVARLGRADRTSREATR